MSDTDNSSGKPLDDLSTALQSLNFGPDWATSATPPAPSAPRNFRDERDDRFGGDRRGERRSNFGGGHGGGERRGGFGGDRGPRTGGFGNGDRRGGHGTGTGGGERRGNFSGGQGGGDRRNGFGGNRGPRTGGFGGGTGGRPNTGERRLFRDDAPEIEFPPRAQRFTPVAEVAFFPDEKTFLILAKAIKASLRTYDLFEIARLFLEKPERFSVGIRPFEPDKHPDQRVWQSVPDRMPFITEQDAIAHVLKNYIDKFFDTEVVTVEPPKGNFQMVAKCGITGEILGAPNYHGYQQTLREHHAARLPQMSFDRFTSRIETVRDKEQVDAWLQRMTQVTRYKLKDRRDGEPEQFDSLAAARAFLVANRREKIVRSDKNIHFPGTVIESLPFGPLRSAVERELDYQRTFPLATANFLRNRLRKLGFVLSNAKRNGRDVAQICAVERKFRTAGTIFADSIQSVLDYIEKHPRIKAADLPEKFLGIAPDFEFYDENGNRVEPPAKEEPPATAAGTETAAAGEATNAGEAAADAADAADATATTAATGETTAGAAEAITGEAAPASSEKPAPGSEKSAPTKKDRQRLTRKKLPPDLKNPAIRELLNTLRWLISEGYVTEFSTGDLLASPVLSDDQLKARSDARARSHAHAQQKGGTGAKSAGNSGTNATGTAGAPHVAPQPVRSTANQPKTARGRTGRARRPDQQQPETAEATGTTAGSEATGTAGATAGTDVAGESTAPEAAPEATPEAPAPAAGTDVASEESRPQSTAIDSDRLQSKDSEATAGETAAPAPAPEAPAPAVGEDAAPAPAPDAPAPTPAPAASEGAPATGVIAGGSIAVSAVAKSILLAGDPLAGDPPAA